MEATHQQQQEQLDLGNKNNNSSTSSYLCRQSSSRWTPTNDQIRILKELYYNNGIRSPTGDQIQRIAARLRHYGKIEGKNVFYWFQNHKARERQKKRFTPLQSQPQPPPPSTATPFSDHHHSHHMHIQSHHQLPQFYNYQQQQPQQKLYSTHHHISPPVEVGSSSSQVVLPVGCGAYGSIAMERSFRECSISPEDSRVAGETIHNMGSWGVYSYSFDNIKPQNGNPDEDDDDDGDGDLSAEIETLPLFPIHGGSTTTTTTGSDGSHHDIYTGGAGGWFRSDGRTSLELSLNSYGYYN